jgi:hypothetical protein
MALPSSLLAPLLDFRRACPDPTVTLTFEQVEAILGYPLPDSARKYSYWWHSRFQTHGHWEAMGWKMSLSMAAEMVTFTRIP